MSHPTSTKRAPTTGLKGPYGDTSTRLVLVGSGVFWWVLVAIPHPLPLLKFLNLKWGGTVLSHKKWFGDPTSCHLSQNQSFYGVGPSHLVPHASKPSVFLGWGGPTSSRLFPNPQSLWGWTVPPGPPCFQNLSFYGMGQSHLVPPASKPLVLWAGMVQPRPTYSQTIGCMV